ncbi:MAG: hypothetical protein ACI9QL_002962 [Candidatus Omnitrophota bacterium]|jgi:hypothetical protein
MNLPWGIILVKPLLLLLFLLQAGVAAEPLVELRATPGHGIQPRIPANGKDLLISYRGGDKGGDLYLHDLKTDAEPVRINARDESAIAMGTIRGAQAAIGRSGHVHVVWNGSGIWKSDDRNGPPMLYARSVKQGKPFEAEQIISDDWGVDGGGAVAADAKGQVYVVFHAGRHEEGEKGRRIYLKHSGDDGRRFELARPVSPMGTGVCGCCAMQAFVDRTGHVYIVYRTADGTNRDIMLLVSTDGGKTFAQRRIDSWKVDRCPMSSMSFAESARGVLVGWEKEQQVYVGLLKPGTTEWLVSAEASGQGKGRKHPVFAVGPEGTILLAWTENTGWKRGGSGAYELFDADLRSQGPAHGFKGVAVWSFVAAVPHEKSFRIFR